MSFSLPRYQLEHNSHSPRSSQYMRIPRPTNALPPSPSHLTTYLSHRKNRKTLKAAINFFRSQRPLQTKKSPTPCAQHRHNLPPQHETVCKQRARQKGSMPTRPPRGTEPNALKADSWGLSSVGCNTCMLGKGGLCRGVRIQRRRARLGEETHESTIDM